MEQLQETAAFRKAKRIALLSLLGAFTPWITKSWRIYTFDFGFLIIQNFKNTWSIYHLWSDLYPQPLPLLHVLSSSLSIIAFALLLIVYVSRKITRRNAVFVSVSAIVISVALTLSVYDAFATYQSETEIIFLQTFLIFAVLTLFFNDLFLLKFLRLCDVKPQKLDKILGSYHPSNFPNKYLALLITILVAFFLIYFPLTSILVLGIIAGLLLWHPTKASVTAMLSIFFWALLFDLILYVGVIVFASDASVISLINADFIILRISNDIPLQMLSTAIIAFLTGLALSFVPPKIRRPPSFLRLEKLCLSDERLRKRIFIVWSIVFGFTVAWASIYWCIERPGTINIADDWYSLLYYDLHKGGYSVDWDYLKKVGFTYDSQNNVYIKKYVFQVAKGDKIEVKCGAGGITLLGPLAEVSIKSPDPFYGERTYGFGGGTATCQMRSSGTCQIILSFTQLPTSLHVKITKFATSFTITTKHMTPLEYEMWKYSYILLTVPTAIAATLLTIKWLQKKET
ncbi:MAG: hypothetical protein QW146_07765 [Candidatus Bathyarchaeia archaeon]